jgi:hypothetical protein
LTAETATPARLLVRAKSGSMGETAAWATKGQLLQVGRALAHYDQESMEILSDDSPLLAIRGGHVVGLAERAWPGPFEADGIGLQARRRERDTVPGVMRA